METITTWLQWLLHFDSTLTAFVSNYGAWAYPLLFTVIFVETGLVVMPFLPGDSLLFVAGALAATGALHLGWLAVLLVVAAVAGDALNYHVGAYLGARAARSRWIKAEHLARTERFFARHGGKAIVLARFVPIVRTFAPFVAGMGRMGYRRFLVYNVGGGLVWVLLFLAAGYYFGGLPLVRENFSLIIPVIILISLLPLLFEALQARRAWRRPVASDSGAPH